MKTSWIIGVVLFWIALFVGASIIKQASSFGSEQTSLLSSFFQLQMVNSSNVVSNITTIISNVGAIMLGFIKLIFLYDPTVWSGSYVWIWMFMCVPVGVGIAISIVFIMRGVGSK